MQNDHGKFQQKSLWHASKVVASIYLLCYSIYNPILYTLLMIKKITIFNKKPLFSIKITFCVEFRNILYIMQPLIITYRKKLDLRMFDSIRHSSCVLRTHFTKAKKVTFWFIRKYTWRLSLPQYFKKILTISNFFSLIFDVCSIFYFLFVRIILTA